MPFGERFLYYISVRFVISHLEAGKKEGSLVDILNRNQKF